MATTATSYLANDPTTEGPLWVAVTIPILVLTYLVAITRIWWRLKIVGRLSASDICIIISLVCATIQEIVGCIAILQFGFGHHAAYANTHKPFNTQKSLLYFYIYQVFYKTLVGTTKMSFVFLYLELFPITWFMWTCHVANASIVAAIIAFDAVTIFQCTPVAFFWNRTLPGGHCVGTAAFWYGHAAWNTCADIMVLFLPIPVIRSLQMGQQQKMAVVGVFGLGAFVIVASVLRMIALDPASKTVQSDLTFTISSSNAFLWTQIEASVAIICACLPTLKRPLMRLFPKLFSSLSSRNRSGAEQSYHLESTSKMGSTTYWRDGDAYSRSQQRKDDLDDDAASQERIIGITKTVDVEVVAAPRRDTKSEADLLNADQIMFREGRH